MPAGGRGIVLATLTTLLLALALGPALAQDDPQSNPYDGEGGTLGEAQGPGTVQPGTEATFAAGGFAPGAEVHVAVAGVVIWSGTVIADQAGVARAIIQVPCPTPAGEVTITLTGEGENGETRVVEIRFTVTGNPAAVCARRLASTGGNISNGLLLAAALLVVGGGAVYAARRKRHDGATHETVDV